MQLGIIIYSNDAETVWNAFRLANFAVKQGDVVKIFLLAKGVEYEALSNERFTITEQAETFIQHGGTLLACGTCLKSRNQNDSELCPLSTMSDLHTLVKESDKIISF